MTKKERQKLLAWSADLHVDLDDVIAMGGKKFDDHRKNLVVLNVFPLDMRVKAVKEYAKNGTTFHESF